MKISKSILTRICILAGFILFTQLSFATDPVPIPPDGSPLPEPGRNGPTIMVSASAELSETDLAVYFEWSVGDATITVYDESNNVVDQQVVDTNTTTEVYIPVDNWQSGTYMLTVKYGTTTQRGYFQL
jgi:Protein of unknown function (DUF3244).